jgi:hypothetical protein
VKILGSKNKQGFTVIKQYERTSQGNVPMDAQSLNHVNQTRSFDSQRNAEEQHEQTLYMRSMIICSRPSSELQECCSEVRQESGS